MKSFLHDLFELFRVKSEEEFQEEFRACQEQAYVDAVADVARGNVPLSMHKVVTDEMLCRFCRQLLAKRRGA